MRIIVLAVFALAGLIATPGRADACTCLPAGPPCEDFWRATAVFLGRVEDVTRDSTARMRVLADRRVTFTVLEAFAGVAPGRIEVRTGAGGGDCGYNFVEGRDYVVHARRDSSGQLVTSICSRTRPAEDAAADLDYARALAAGREPAGYISGEINLVSRRFGRPDRAPEPLAGIAVTLERNGEVHKAVTDIAGRFRIDDLEAGAYDIEFELNDEYYAQVYPDPVELRHARGCASVTATAHHNGRVSGRIVTAGGDPVPGLTVELTTRAEPGLWHERVRAATGANGSFELARVPPGEFVISVPLAAEGGRPPDRIYHPGVPDSAAATRIELGPGERVKITDLVLPSSLDLVRIEGTVIESDGMPAPDARVFLKSVADGGQIVSEPVPTDHSGRFVLTAPAGRQYEIFAERQRSDDGTPRVDSSDPLSITATKGAPPVKLTLRRRY